MNTAGCFQPGATGSRPRLRGGGLRTGAGLMLPDSHRQKGTIDASSPQFSYSFHPFPGGTEPDPAHDVAPPSPR